MNGRKFKQLKKAVASMRLGGSIEEYEISEIVKVSDYLKKVSEGLTESQIEGLQTKHPDPDKYLKIKSTKIRALNHIEKLKSFYIKFGEETCIHEYLKWLTPHHTKMIEKYPTLFKKVDDAPPV